MGGHPGSLSGGSVLSGGVVVSGGREVGSDFGLVFFGGSDELGVLEVAFVLVGRSGVLERVLGVVVGALVVERDVREPEVVVASRPVSTDDGGAVVVDGTGLVASARRDIRVTVPAKRPPSSMPASATATGTWCARGGIPTRANVSPQQGATVRCG